jgi:APA family basic amino acid/polyamine antiporter
MSDRELQRVLGLPGAVWTGLGSIVGTGVFVSLGLAAGITGPSMPLALVLAAVLAGLNGLSSAQLAAAWPVSGGTYEYANRAIGPRAGFSAGWMFLSAKSASAATAALGLSGYALGLLGVEGGQVPAALAAVAAITGLVLAGLRRSSAVNAVIVSFTLAALLALIAACAPAAESANLSPLLPTSSPGAAADLLHATALLFVAYTGYGRIATLGEEVRDPQRTIPRAIAATLGVVLVLYLGVGLTALAVLGAPGFAAATTAGAPLEAVARAAGAPRVATLVAFGAITAMAGVLLNLVLGLSRVALAMGRRGDLPRRFEVVEGGSPRAAVLLVGGVIAALVLVGDIERTWTFSAFTVLIYYALTNLSALRLPEEHRRYPRWTAAAGLLGCLSLALWVEPAVWAAGLGLLALGHTLRQVLRR